MSGPDELKKCDLCGKYYWITQGCGWFCSTICRDTAYNLISGGDITWMNKATTKKNTNIQGL